MAGCNGRFMQGCSKVPASAHSADIGVYVFAPASTERRTPLQAIRSLQGHPTGGPSLRDGHSQLSHRIKRIGSAREKRMENDFLLLHALPCCIAERRNPLPRFAVPRSAKHDNIDYAATFGTGGVERSASASPMRTPPHQTVRADFPHTASRVKLVSSVSPSCEGYQPEFL